MIHLRQGPVFVAILFFIKEIACVFQDGFMVPVLLGFFDPVAATNFEQPASSWGQYN